MSRLLPAPRVDIRCGQRRRKVTEVIVIPPRGGRGVAYRAIVRLSCGHVALRQYAMAVGQTAYCGPCSEEPVR